VVALARNVDLTGPCVLACLTAVLLPCLHRATAWEMGTSILLGCRHGVLQQIQLRLQTPNINAVANEGLAGGRMVSTESAVAPKDCPPVKWVASARTIPSRKIARPFRIAHSSPNGQAALDSRPIFRLR
jgi:hypothetical protein